MPWRVPTGVGSHPFSSTSLSKRHGPYSHAEPLYVRALSIYEEQLGPTHPDVAIDLNNLALLYQAQGKHGQAEPLMRRALSILEQALGQDHPNTQTVRANYGRLLDDMKGKPSQEP